MLSYCMFFRGNHPPFHSSKATLLSSMEIWELENVFASIMLPIWYKAARMRSLTNPTRHKGFVWERRNFLCNIPRHTGTHRKKPQGDVTRRSDAIMTYKGLNFGDGHCSENWCKRSWVQVVDVLYNFPPKVPSRPGLESRFLFVCQNVTLQIHWTDENSMNCLINIVTWRLRW